MTTREEAEYERWQMTQKTIEGMDRQLEQLRYLKSISQSLAILLFITIVFAIRFLFNT